MLEAMRSYSAGVSGAKQLGKKVRGLYVYYHGTGFMRGVSFDRILRISRIDGIMM
jgi:hypothetical protein